jgi:acetate kinase
MRILIVNAGSSSLKLRVVDDDDAVVGTADLPAIDIDGDGGAVRAADLEREIAEVGPVDAVGHRIVHGGLELTEAVRVDEGLVGRIEALSELAPLHQPRSLAALRAARAALPEVPHVACFDTAFHATIPEPAATYALPAAWRQRWPLRRFGFHGLSHAWSARRAAELLGRRPADLRIVTCHLGAGASLAAVAGGRSVDTTMGFTPLEGLVMATRSGSVDPGLVLWLQRQGGLSAAEVADGLEHGGGLVGLAGTADMREVLAGAERGDAGATLARDVYLHRLRGSIAAMASSLGGLDALVFTGGVGEHAPAIRAGAVDGLGVLGLAVDPDANEAATPDARIEAAGATPVLVIESREDLEIAAQVRATLA